MTQALFLGANYDLVKRTLFLIAIGVQFSWLHGQEVDKPVFFGALSNLYKSIHDTAIPTITRPLISAPFDMVTISRQITGNSYAGIVAGFDTHYAPVLSKIFKAHALEMTLRSSVYFIYSYTTRQTRQYFPDLSREYPFLPELVAVSAIALCDLGFANPFERMKVCFINNIPIPFYRNEKLVMSDLVKNREWLLKGGTLTVSSSAIHIGTFLTLNHHLKKILFKKEGALTFYESCVLGPVMSTVQTTVTYPLLTLRARLHAERFKVGQGDLSAFQYIRTLWHSNNLSSLYHGWRARVVRGTLMAIFDTYWINSTKR